MSRVDSGSGMPRAMIHRRILDVAASQPDASLAGIADEVSGATEELVDRVLSEYGDPADQPEGSEHAVSGLAGNVAAESTNGHATGPDDAVAATAPTTDPQDDMQPNGHADDEHDEGEVQTMSIQKPEPTTEHEVPTVEDCSEKQRTTLQLIRDRPEATQGELAAHFDVTRATISRWLADVPGFEWQDRREFVAAVPDDALDGGPDAAEMDAPASESDDDAPTEGSDLHAEVQELSARVDALADQIDGTEPADANPDPTVDLDGIDPDLAHRVLHACLDSEHISEAEELQLLRTFISD
ncbi:hypothetical protein VB773_01185 [Haloarculaceae archaeon H-GB2-1]|nr:hypothetical protein [Haloarculaceae archaeon H-GB1-1]MEA5406328.1 hypothetical protein [Haloarculaceae archaeon H-GB2-1]